MQNSFDFKTTAIKIKEKASMYYIFKWLMWDIIRAEMRYTKIPILMINSKTKLMRPLLCFGWFCFGALIDHNSISLFLCRNVLHQQNEIAKYKQNLLYKQSVVNICISDSFVSRQPCSTHTLQRVFFNRYSVYRSIHALTMLDYFH